MFTTAITLAQLLQSCAPNIGSRTMTAIVRVESGGKPLAIRDNTANHSYSPESFDQAVHLAKYLLNVHHNLDLGISQVNSSNLGWLGLSVGDAFNPCSNLHAGAAILADDYRRAVSQFGPGQYALRRAIGAYNTGSLYAGDHYISMILAAAGINEQEGNAVPDIAGATASADIPVMRSAPVTIPVAASTPVQTASLLSTAIPPAPAPPPAALQSTEAPTVIHPESSPILVHVNVSSMTNAAANASGNASGSAPQPASVLPQQGNAPQPQTNAPTPQGAKSANEPVVLVRRR